MKVACVIPVGPGREDNLTEVLRSVGVAAVTPNIVVLVGDGPEGTKAAEFALDQNRNARMQIVVHAADKHQPGMEQPRNIGVRVAEEAHGGGLTHVWFLDSDCIVERHTLMAFEWADYQQGKPGQRILLGRYDWLAQGAEGPDEGLEMLDPRKDSFAVNGAGQTFTHDLSAGLACFSGNLVWPIDRFKHVGGFWNEIHHGRCEDGELGLRAVQMGIPIGFVREAQAWHLWHERNQRWAEEANARDVPMLNERHPWLEKRCTCGHQEQVHNVVESEHIGECQICKENPCACKEQPMLPPQRLGACRDCMCEAFKQAVFVVEEDGRRFDAACGLCDWTGNTAEIWAHEATHSLR